MLLNSLDITVNGEVIRSVEFKKGLNFIVDSTARKSTESGNSVGKTTVLRVIDFCLGSDGGDIYKDPEFKGEKNKDVYKFLTENEVIATLRLGTKSGREVTLVRDVNDQPSLFKIDGEEFSSIKLYQSFLKEFLFGQTRNKPTLRQLMPKFIRSDGHKMSHSLRYLHQSTSDAYYETLHLTLFGFRNIDILNKKQGVYSELSKAKKRRTALKQGQSVVALRQSLKVIERDISKKEKEISDFEVGETYQEESKKLESVQKEVSRIALSLNEKRMRANYIGDALRELKDNESKSDSQTIKKIYQEASSFISDLHVTFEETLDFHEKMISRKVDHLNGRLSRIELECQKLEELLDLKAREEKGLLEFISSTGSLNDLKLMNEQLNRLFESKGNKLQALELLESAEDKVKALEESLEELNSEIEYYLSDLEKKVSIFNEDFSFLSKSFYDEEYILSYDFIKDKIRFTISNVDGNVGGGKKKGQVAAFDLAYINFIDKIKLSSPRFVMHDSVEDVHNNQLHTLFKYAASFEGQYVLSVLKDKIINVEGFDPSPYIRLELNESDKFFKVGCE